jgi:hypothetical protein
VADSVKYIFIAVNEYSAEPLYPPLTSFKNNEEKETFKVTHT